MLNRALENLAFYLDAGGYVMLPLLLSSLLIWYGIGYRWSVLYRPNARSVRRLLQKHAGGHTKVSEGIVEQAVVKGLAVARENLPHLRRHLDAAFGEDEKDLQRFGRTVQSLIAAAPILGLLGTVDGMIATFTALGEMQLFNQSGGIAGGISQALFTTQLGLAVAIPGLVVNGFLERRVQERLVELTQLKDMLCVQADELATDTLSAGETA